MIGSLLINAALALEIAHVLRWPAYLGSVRWHHLLPWAIALNLATAAILLALTPEEDRSRLRTYVWIGDWIVCLFVLGLVRALRIPDPQHMARVFGALWSGFIFARIGVLVVWVSLFRERRPAKLRAAVFLVSLIIYVAITAWIAASVTANGDEPHYLLLTHSLLHDHDFDLRNNYDHRDWQPFYFYDLRDRHIITNQRGQQMPFHDVGLSVLLLPGYAAGNRVGAMMEINMAAALLALGIFEMALQFGATDAGGIACWALFGFVSPLITFAAQIYPEIPGSALTLWAVLCFAMYLNVGYRWAIPVAGCLLAVLPWLSIRFWVVLGPLGLVVALTLLARLRLTRAFAREFAWLAAPTAISTLLYCLFNLWGYGKFEPNAGYIFFLPTLGRPMFEPQAHVGLLGLFFDRAFGLVPTAPIYLVAIAGAWPALRSRRALALALLAPSVATILFTAPNHWWYGGTTPPPSRYIVIALALLAPLAAPMLSRGVSRGIVTLLAAWSFLVAFEFTAFPEPRHTFWDAAQGGVVKTLDQHAHIDLGSAFPSLVQPVHSDYILSAIWTIVTVALIAIMLWQFNSGMRREASPSRSAI